MNLTSGLKRNGGYMLSAVQFLTRIPLPSVHYEKDSLARAVKYFPLVGALIGGIAALLHKLLVTHLGRLPAAVVIVIFLVWITGCFHEDGLADSFDAFGGGYGREKILLILRDSRIGSYGAAALCLGLVARIVFISSLSLGNAFAYLIVAHVLCRWTTLPLSYFLPPAREEEGQGIRIARLTAGPGLALGTLFSFCIAGGLLRWRACAPIAAAVLITLLSARFYTRKIGGVTGDCFGATNQLTEVAVYLCGVWTL